MSMHLIVVPLFVKIAPIRRLQWFLKDFKSYRSISIEEVSMKSLQDRNHWRHFKRKSIRGVDLVSMLVKLRTHFLEQSFSVGIAALNSRRHIQRRHGRCCYHKSLDNNIGQANCAVRGLWRYLQSSMLSKQVTCSPTWVPGGQWKLPHPYPPPSLLPLLLLGLPLPLLLLGLPLPLLLLGLPLPLLGLPLPLLGLPLPLLGLPLPLLGLPLPLLLLGLPFCRRKTRWIRSRDGVVM
jgi:hypothetical protein